MADVFVSYSHADRAWVSSFATALQEEGFSVWWDPSLLPGTKYRDAIRNELDTAKAVVAVWSRASIDSDWVRDEAEEARSSRRLIPVIMESVKPPHGFGQIQISDLSQWKGRRTDVEFRQVIAAIGALTGTPSYTPILTAQHRAKAKRAVSFLLNRAWATLGVIILITVTVVVSLAIHAWINVTREIHNAPSVANVAPRIAALPPAYKFRTGFRDCANCPEMVPIPAGRFLMGEPHGDYTDETPAHNVAILRPIAVGRYDITFEDWEACVEDGQCGGYRPDDRGWGREKRPVINVSWYDAKVYIRWLSKKTGERYRLLSEAEWEFAARAGTTSLYYWGASPGNGNALCRGCESSSTNKTMPVGSFPPNAFGLYDMAGNVWQWTEDCFKEVGGYTGTPNDGSPVEQNGCKQRVLRGGAWSGDVGDVRTADRNQTDPDAHSADTGFRVAKDLSQ
jgi:formylglycine-generating enzyme required for sulfatase activity